jgi:hypothetical protein
LEQAYKISRERRQIASRRLGEIAKVLDRAGIQWMSLKGTVQAERLYEDPAWRMSSDIDLLVDKTEFGAALDVLTQHQFISSNPPVPRQRFLSRLLLGAVDAATLIAEDDKTCAVEVHQRLFFAAGSHFLPLPTVSDPIPSPSLSPELVLYLVAHGSISMWVRLKWLVDLVPAVQKLSPTQLLAMTELAEEAGLVKSAVASLLFLRELFPFVPIEPLAPWLAAHGHLPGVRTRLRLYKRMLELPTDWKRSPLDNRWQALKANFLLWERLAPRVHIVAFSPISSLARAVAGALNRKHRLLTHSDVPPHEMPDTFVA